jgi:hypothetical protein
MIAKIYIYIYIIKSKGTNILINESNYHRYITALWSYGSYRCGAQIIMLFHPIIITTNKDNCKTLIITRNVTELVRF